MLFQIKGILRYNFHELTYLWTTKNETIAKTELKASS